MDDGETVTTTTDSTTSTGDRSVTAALVGIFNEVLDEPGAVDADTDFFDAGGNSLLAALVVAQVRRAHGVRITLREIFDAGTARRLAAVVTAKSAA